MISLSLPEVKQSMSELLLSDSFDSFSLIECEIATFCTFTIDGALNKDFFGEEASPSRRHVLWGDVRDFCFALIRGKRTPLRVKIVLALPDEETAKLISDAGAQANLSNIRGFFLNLKYDKGAFTCTTGVAMSDFTADKSPEYVWDEKAPLILSEKGIPCEAVL